MDDKINETPQENKAPTPLSTGAGIAIAGIWFASMVLTLAAFTFFFVWPDPIGSNGKKVTGDQVFFAALLVAIPMALAWSMTKKLIGK